MFRWIETLHPWAMTEVYLLGVLVAFVKLSDIATIVPGWRCILAALIVVMAATDAALEPEAIWGTPGAVPMNPGLPITAARAALARVTPATC